MGVWRVDFLHQSSYCTRSWTHSLQATLEFKQKKKACTGWGEGFPLYSILHPPIASLFNRTFLKADTLPLGFLVLINDSVTGPTHSPEFLEFGPVALIKHEQEGHTALALACLFCGLIGINICLLPTDLLQPHALTAFLCWSPDLGLEWVERDWQEE